MPGRAVFVALIGLFGSLLTAQTPAPAPIKIGTINLNAAVAGTRDGKNANSAMEAKFASRRKAIENQQTEITRISDELRKPGSTLPDDKRSAMERDIADRQKKLDRDKQDYQEDLQREQQSFLQQIDPKLVQALEKYARDHGYTLIFDVSTRGGAVLYGASDDDITANVIAAYDNR